LREYRGEPHRVQWVAQVAGIDYIDDSKGTNVGATVAALRGLGQPVVLIAGGEGKGQDFSPLADSIASRVRAVVLLGKDALIIESALAFAAKTHGIEILHVDSLPKAVAVATRAAQPGDAVLLSPACASLDMFRDYTHRADVFVEAVLELAREAGQPC
jgi:UDP-N-acetylmuramoylalanine--D-glutamate ligase